MSLCNLKYKWTQKVSTKTTTNKLSVTCGPFKLRETSIYWRSHSIADAKSSLAASSPHHWQPLLGISVCTDPHHNPFQLPINIISAAGQLVIICLVLLGSHSQTSSDSINDLNNGPVIIDADNFESYLIPQINSASQQYTITANHFIRKTMQDYQIHGSLNKLGK